MHVQGKHVYRSSLTESTKALTARSSPNLLMQASERVKAMRRRRSLGVSTSALYILPECDIACSLSCDQGCRAPLCRVSRRFSLQSVIFLQSWCACHIIFFILHADGRRCCSSREDMKQGSLSHHIVDEDKDRTAPDHAREEVQLTMAASKATTAALRRALASRNSSLAASTTTSRTATALQGHAHSTQAHQQHPPPSANLRWIHSFSPRRAHFSFDTSSLVARLEKEGLRREQALGVMEALEEVIEESIRTMTANLVTRAEQEKHQYTQKVDFAKLKSEITLLEKQDFSLLKSENERLLSEL